LWKSEEMQEANRKGTNRICEEKMNNLSDVPKPWK
jgi:hypothetical protein